jgi:hypothetical protein
MANGQQVFIRRAFVVEDPMAIARAMAGVAPIMAMSSGGSGGSGDSGGGENAPVLSSAVVPEPSSLVAAILGTIGLAQVVRRRRRW